MNATIRIEPLCLSHHLSISQQLPDFWGKQNSVAKFHAPLIPLFFEETSFVLVQENLILSYLYGIISKKNAFVHVLATRQGHYRKKYASRLLAHWEKVLHKEGAENFYAYTVERNFLSQRFFLSQHYSLLKKIEVFPKEFRNLYLKKYA